MGAAPSIDQAVQLKARVCQSEKDLEQAAARVAELIDAAAAARRDSDARLGKIQDALDASEARAAAAEKEAEESFASRKETMAAARVAAGSDGNENAVAMAAEAEAAVKELSRLKKALREERSQHEEILLASRCVSMCGCRRFYFVCGQRCRVYWSVRETVTDLSASMCCRGGALWRERGEIELEYS